MCVYARYTRDCILVCLCEDRSVLCLRGPCSDDQRAGGPTRTRSDFPRKINDSCGEGFWQARESQYIYIYIMLYTYGWGIMVDLHLPFQDGVPMISNHIWQTNTLSGTGSNKKWRPAKLPMLQGELLRDVYGNYVALDLGWTKLQTLFRFREFQRAFVE